MKSAEDLKEVKRAIRAHNDTRIPDSRITESEELRRGRRYAVLRVALSGRRVDIYIYDDGDFGFANEDGAWFPLEIWDEKDDRKRLEKLFDMLKLHTAMFGRERMRVP